MGKVKILLTEEVLASAEQLQAVLAENPEAVAAEIITLVADKNLQAEQLKVLEKENTDNVEKIAALELELEDLKTEASVYQKTNVELSKQLAEKSDLNLVQNGQEKPSPKFEDKTFELDGVTYGFNYPKTTINRVAVDVDHIVASAELQKQLVAMKSGMIKVIE